jgi:hypothetical protein
LGGTVYLQVGDSIVEDIGGECIFCLGGVLLAAERQLWCWLWLVRAHTEGLILLYSFLLCLEFDLFLLGLVSLHEFVAVLLHHSVLLLKETDLLLELVIVLAEVEDIPGYDLACVLELVHGERVFLDLSISSV